MKSEDLQFLFPDNRGDFSSEALGGKRGSGCLCYYTEIVGQKMTMWKTLGRSEQECRDKIDFGKMTKCCETLI